MLDILRNWFRKPFNKPKKPSGWSTAEANAFDAMLGGFEETIVALKATTCIPEPGDQAPIWRPKPYINASAVSPDFKIDMYTGDVELQHRYVPIDGGLVSESRAIYRDRAGKIERTTEWEALSRITWS